MKNARNKGLLFIGACLLLSACGPNTNTSSTDIEEPDLYSSELKRPAKIFEFEAPKDKVSLVYDEDNDSADLTIVEGRRYDRFREDNLPRRTHVRLPGIRVDSDEADGSVHIKAPFVRINKYSGEERTRIKAPFVNIDADD
ncbi:MAG: hypothetical protein K2W82_05920 [Candidatus Obscuribacterales bacterium]|nr:hypothetical protein [Candidatus Obscuribacterales bacterium]